MSGHGDFLVPMGVFVISFGETRTTAFFAFHFTSALTFTFFAHDSAFAVACIARFCIDFVTREVKNRHVAQAEAFIAIEIALAGAFFAFFDHNAGSVTFCAVAFDVTIAVS